MQIEIVRTLFTETTSSGKLFINGEEICFTLEDAARAYGVKVQGKTCLPAGTYSVTITPSARFKRPMILIYTNPKDLSCENGGIRFTGVRLHDGVTHLNTEGCVCVGRIRDSADRIHSPMESVIFNRVKAAIDAGEKVTLIIRNETGK